MVEFILVMLFIAALLFALYLVLLPLGVAGGLMAGIIEAVSVGKQAKAKRERIAKARKGLKERADARAKERRRNGEE